MSYKEPRALTNDFGLITLAGDLGGTAALPSVLSVNGSSVPAGGSLTTGNVLQVSGSSSLTYGPINLAGGSHYITGNLPVANFAPGTSGQVLMSNGTPATTWTTLSNDVTIGATGATTVNSISGSSPIAISPSVLQWGSGTTSPTLNQLANTVSSGTGLTLTIQAQNATGGGASVGGNLALTSGTGATVGNVNIQTGGTTRLSVSPGTTTISNALTQSGGAVSITGNTTSQVSTSSGNLTVDSAAALNLGTSAATSVSISKSGVTSTVNGALTVTQATTLNNSLTQSGGAFSLTGNAASQISTTSTNALTITSGAASTWSTSAGALTVDSATALNLGSVNATSAVIGNTANTTAITINGTSSSTINLVPPSILWGAAVTTPSIKQTQIASGAGTPMTIQAQQGATTGNQTGGNLVLSAGAGGGSGTTGDLLLQLGGTTQAFVTNNASGAGLGIGSTPGTSPTVTQGTGVPATTEPNGSIFLRSDGTAATAIYSRQSGAWVPIGGTGGGGSSLSSPITVGVNTNNTHAIYTIDTTGGSSDYIILNSNTLSPVVPGASDGYFVVTTGSPVITSIASITLNDGYCLVFDGDTTTYVIAATNTGTTFTLTQPYQGTINQTLSGTFTATSGSGSVTTSRDQTGILAIGSTISFPAETGTDTIHTVTAISSGNLTVTPTLANAITSATGITYSKVLNASAFSYYAGIYKLPAPTTGRSLQIKDTTGYLENNPITILPHTSENIDGAPGLLTFNTPFMLLNGSDSVQTDPLIGTTFGAITFNLTTNSGTLSASSAVTIPNGARIIFSSEPNAIYTLSAAISASTSITITPKWGGATTSGLTAVSSIGFLCTAGSATVTASSSVANLLFPGSYIQFIKTPNAVASGPNGTSASTGSGSTTNVTYQVASVSTTTVTLTSAFTDTTSGLASSATAYTASTVSMQSLGGTFTVTNESNIVICSQSQTGYIGIGSQIYFAVSGTLQMAGVITGLTTANSTSVQSTGNLNSSISAGSFVTFNSQTSPSTPFVVASVGNGGGTGGGFTLTATYGSGTGSTTANVYVILTVTYISADGKTIKLSQNYAGTSSSAATAIADITNTPLTAIGGSQYGTFTDQIVFGSDTTYYPITNLASEVTSQHSYTVTNGSTAVTSSASETTRLTGGQNIIFGSQPTVQYTLASTSGTSLVLTTPYTGTSFTSTYGIVTGYCTFNITLTNNSTSVTYTNDDFQGTKLMVGTPVIFSSQPSSVYIITSFRPAQAFTITPAYTGASASAVNVYSLPSGTPRLKLATTYSGTTGTVTSCKIPTFQYTSNKGTLNLLSPDGTNWITLN